MDGWMDGWIETLLRIIKNVINHLAGVGENSLTNAGT